MNWIKQKQNQNKNETKQNRKQVQIHKTKQKQEQNQNKKIIKTQLITKTNKQTNKIIKQINNNKIKN